MTTTTSINKILHSKKGQSLIELTLITPLMLLLVFGVVEVGSVISTYLTLTHTTREGANLTSRGTAPNTALDAIIAAAAPTIQNSNSGAVENHLFETCPKARYTLQSVLYLHRR